MSQIHENLAVMETVFRHSAAFHDWQLLRDIIHVNRAWRAIALATPELWTWVPIFCQRTKQDHPIGKAFLRFLRKFGQWPVELEIVARRPFEPSEHQWLSELAPSVKRLVIKPNTSTLIHVLMSYLGLPLEFPVLESFACVTKQSESFSLQWRPHTFCFPRITHTGSIDWKDWGIKGLSQLTSLVFTFTERKERPKHADMRQILIMNRDTLQHFAYTGFSPLPDDSVPSQGCSYHRFPALRSLSLSYSDDIYRLLRGTIFETPNLDKLYIRDLYHCPKQQIRETENRTFRRMNTRELFQILANLCPATASLRSLSLLGIKDGPGRLGGGDGPGGLGIRDRGGPGSDLINQLFRKVASVEYLTLYNVHRDFSDALRRHFQSGSFISLKQLMLTDLTALPGNTEPRLQFGRNLKRMDKFFYADQSRTVDRRLLLEYAQEVVLIDPPQDGIYTSKQPLIKYRW